MNYSKKPKVSWVRRIWTGIKYLGTGLFAFGMLSLAVYGLYREITDIDYVEPHVVTELGQCSGDNSNTKCKARAGRLLITADSPMMVGQTMYRECWIQRDGGEFCQGWTYKTWGDPFRAEALREHQERL